MNHIDKMNQILDRLAEVINKELLRKGKSCLCFGELCGLSKNIIGDITSRKRTDIKLSTIVKVCEYSDIDIRQIFGDFKPEEILNGATITILGKKYRIKLEEIGG